MMPSVSAEKQIARKTRLGVTVALTVGLLIYTADLLFAFFGHGLLLFVFGESVFEVDWQNQLLNAFLSVWLLLPAGIFLTVVYRRNPLRILAEKPGVPRLPFLFLPMVIGSMYLMNLTVNICFGSLLEPFEMPVDPASLPTSTVGILLYFFELAVIPAIFEELLFRGLLFGKLKEFIGVTPAILLSAFVFGMAHLNPAQSVSAFGFGVFAAYLYAKTGSVWYGVLIHFTNNLVSGYIEYRTELFPTDEAMDAIGLYMIAMIAVAVISAIIYLCTRSKHAEKPHRLTKEERRLPGKTAVIRAVFCNPVLYILLLVYVGLLWLLYFPIAG